MLFASDSPDVGTLCFAFVVLLAVANLVLFAAAYFWTRPRPGEEPAQPAVDDGLAGHRFWRRVMVLGFLSSMPAVWFGGKLGVPFGLTVVPSCLGALCGMMRVYSFRCPRCRDIFVGVWMNHNILANRCVHCGYPHTTAEDSGLDV